MPFRIIKSYALLTALIFGVWFTIYIPFIDDWMIALVLALVDSTAAVTTVVICNEILIPKFLFKRKFLVFITTFFAFLVTAVAINVWLVRYIMERSEELNKYAHAGIGPSLLWHFTFNLTLSLLWTSFRFYMERFQTQKKLERISHEKTESELAFLKSQVNPHILFNTLNLIYGSVEKGNQNARGMILQLSDMLRYQLYECNCEAVEISREIQYLENFIELQRLRKEGNVKIDLYLEPGLSGFRIAPLLFIPFVENAFKYVSAFEDRDNYIDIRLWGDHKTFFFECINSKEVAVSKAPLKEGGIGIDNVIRRLNLIYPKNHHLDVIEMDQTYGVKMSLILSPP
jgi:two-component system LytT family sensor kinase